MTLVDAQRLTYQDAIVVTRDQILQHNKTLTVKFLVSILMEILMHNNLILLYDFQF